MTDSVGQNVNQVPAARPDDRNPRMDRLGIDHCPDGVGGSGKVRRGYL